MDDNNDLPISILEEIRNGIAQIQEDQARIKDALVELTYLREQLDLMRRRADVAHITGAVHSINEDCFAIQNAQGNFWHQDVKKRWAHTLKEGDRVTAISTPKTFYDKKRKVTSVIFVIESLTKLYL